MNKTFLYQLFFLCFIPFTVKAQPGTSLKELLHNKSRLGDIMKTVNAYYRNPATRSRLGNATTNSEYKRWNRWAYYWESRLGSNGEFVNIAGKMQQATGLQQSRTNIIASVAGTWSLMGPSNTNAGIGRADRLAFHPTDPDIIYAGTTAGGLWRTTNGGTAWSNLTADIPSAGISGIVVNRQNPNIIYILTGDGDSDFGGLVESYGYVRYSMGVLKSYDGGVNWRKTAEFPGVDSFLTGFALVADPNDPDILLAATSQGMFRTSNGGQTWDMRSTNLTYDVAFRPGSSDTCYRTEVNNGFSRFLRSTNGGVDWIAASSVSALIDSASRCKIGVAPSSLSVVYLMAGGPAWVNGVRQSGTFTGMYRSANNGTSFSLMTNTPNITSSPDTGARDLAPYNWSLAIAPTNSARLATGAVNVYTSTNSGTTLTAAGAGLHSDVHDLKYNPLDNKLWAACDGGVYYSTDNGASWTSSYNTLSVTQYYHMDVSPFDYLDILGGTQDNGVKRKAGPSSYFDDISGNDGFQVYYHTDSTRVYYSVQNQTIHRSRDSGVTWPNITPTANPAFFPNLVRHPTNGQTLIAATDTIWRTTNGGSSWATYPGIYGKMALCYGISNTSRVYAAGRYSSDTPAIIRRSNDAGVTWPNSLIMNSGANYPVTNQRITCINVNPSNSLNVWVSFGGFSDNIKVYYSPDGGLNWQNMTGSLPNVPVNCLAIDGSNNAYAGTDNGVYYRGAGMNDWVPFYNNLPYVPVTDLIISEAEGRIRAATFGRGLWTSDVYSSCPDSINVSGTLEGQEFYETSNSVTTTASLKVSEGTKVQMRGGNEVRLLPGFTAGDTTQFRALIGPCGSGGGVAGFKTTGTAPVRFIKFPGAYKATLEIKSGSNSLEALINLRSSGTLSFQLTNIQGEILKSWAGEQMEEGLHQENFGVSKAAFSPGLYYVHLYLDGVWQHMQEWEVIR